ncbi:protein kinase domain-containing protein [Streptomyces gamaensis]
MGTVWRAEDELLGRQVAVKRLRVSPYLDEDDLATLYERTRREARSAARITHPNVVVVHDVVEDEGLPCIVMEYVPSTTLGDVLKEGTVTPDEAARIGRGMIAALRAAHAAGVLHRDVKPGNVLLGDNGRVVLTDFGIARSTGTSTLTKTGEMVGSIDYIAPERVKGARPGPASDLWALGATLYEALEGQPPFRRDTAVETAYAIVMDPLPPPRRAGELTRLVETLLAKEPDLRPPAELAEQILREPAARPPTARMAVPDADRAPSPAAPEPEGAEAAAGPEAAGPAGPVRGEDAARADAEAPAAAVPQPDAATGTTAAATAATAATAPTVPVPGAASGPSAAGGERTAAEAARAAADGTAASGGTRKSRALLWGSAAVVAAAVLAGGAYFLIPGSGTDDGSGTTAAPRPAEESGGGRTASASPAAEPVAVPPGYRLAEEKKLGFSVPVPGGWAREAKSPGEINYLSPDGLVGLKINVRENASADHLQHWKEVEKEVRKKVDRYQLRGMQATTHRGEPAALWEFGFQGRARSWRAVDLGFGRPGGTEYAIYLSAPEEQWDRYRPVFEAARDGFRPHR